MERETPFTTPVLRVRCSRREYKEEARELLFTEKATPKPRERRNDAERDIEAVMMTNSLLVFVWFVGDENVILSRTRAFTLTFITLCSICILKTTNLCRRLPRIGTRRFASTPVRPLRRLFLGSNRWLTVRLFSRLYRRRTRGEACISWFQSNVLFRSGSPKGRHIFCSFARCSVTPRWCSLVGRSG